MAFGKKEIDHLIEAFNKYKEVANRPAQQDKSQPPPQYKEHPLFKADGARIGEEDYRNYLTTNKGLIGDISKLKADVDSYIRDLRREQSGCFVFHADRKAAKEAGAGWLSAVTVGLRKAMGDFTGAGEDSIKEANTMRFMLESRSLLDALVQPIASLNAHIETNPCCMEGTFSNRFRELCERFNEIYQSAQTAMDESKEYKVLLPETLRISTTGEQAATTERSRLVV